MSRPNAPAPPEEEALRAWRNIPLVRLNERLLAAQIGEDVARDTLDWAFAAGWSARGGCLPDANATGATGRR